jgi:hypothetical protein
MTSTLRNTQHRILTVVSSVTAEFICRLNVFTDFRSFHIDLAIGADSEANLLLDESNEWSGI